MHAVFFSATQSSSGFDIPIVWPRPGRLSPDRWPVAGSLSIVDVIMMERPTDPHRTAVFTGTFDPISLGHLDVIRRGRLLFDRLVVGIGVNLNKASLFDVEERVEMARRIVRPFPNVIVDSFEGLTVHYVRRIGERVILRGLRRFPTWSMSSE